MFVEKNRRFTNKWCCILESMTWVIHFELFLHITKYWFQAIYTIWIQFDNRILNNTSKILFMQVMLLIGSYNIGENQCSGWIRKYFQQLVKLFVILFYTITLKILNTNLGAKCVSIILHEYRRDSRFFLEYKRTIKHNVIVDTSISINWIFIFLNSSREYVVQCKICIF